MAFLFLIFSVFQFSVFVFVHLIRRDSLLAVTGNLSGSRYKTAIWQETPVNRIMEPGNEAKIFRPQRRNTGKPVKMHWETFN
jgi:hypothetical protein